METTQLHTEQLKRPRGADGKELPLDLCEKERLEAYICAALPTARETVTKWLFIDDIVRAG